MLCSSCRSSPLTDRSDISISSCRLRYCCAHRFMGGVAFRWVRDSIGGNLEVLVLQCVGVFVRHEPALCGIEGRSVVDDVHRLIVEAVVGGGGTALEVDQHLLEVGVVR